MNVSSASPGRLEALDIAFRRPGYRQDRSCIGALDQVLQLLNAGQDEARAALALMAIVNAPFLAEAIVASASPSNPLPPARAPQDAPAEGARRSASVEAGSAGARELIDLHIVLARAEEELRDADMIDNGPRWQREIAAWEATVSQLRNKIAEVERNLA